VNPTIYSTKDFRKRRADRNPFLMKILGLPKLWVIGTEDELAA
jgi:hypothetical protein